MPTCCSWKTGFECWKWRPYEVSAFSNPMPKRTEMALPMPTKSLLQPSSDKAMLFAPFGCTHPHPARSSKGHCKKWQHETESLSLITSTMCPITICMDDRPTAIRETSQKFTCSLNQWSCLMSVYKPYPILRRSLHYFYSPGLFDILVGFGDISN